MYAFLPHTFCYCAFYRTHFAIVRFYRTHFAIVRFYRTHFAIVRFYRTHFAIVRFYRTHFAIVRFKDKICIPCKAHQAQIKQLSLINIAILLQRHTLSYTCII